MTEDMTVTEAVERIIVQAAIGDVWLEKWLNGIGWEKSAANSSFSCGLCDCILITSMDDEEAYLDRFTSADSSGCPNCPCHKTPRRIPTRTRAVTWNTGHLTWGCSRPDGVDHAVCSTCRKKAVAFINPGWFASDYHAPYWVCGNHLGVENEGTVDFTKPYAIARDSEKEPSEYRLLREVMEVALALQYG